MDQVNVKKFRVLVVKEEPSTGLTKKRGTIFLNRGKIEFVPQNSNPNLVRSFSCKDLSSIKVTSIRSFLKKKEVVSLYFKEKHRDYTLYLEPTDITAKFLIETILNYREEQKSSSIQGVFGTFIEKIGDESQKIIKEVSAIIESSSKEITQALDQSIQFIREATENSNILESLDLKDLEGRKTVSLDIEDIDEILKRSLASDKVEAMIAGLIAKGLFSAKEEKITEALEALRIAKEAAEKQNMKEYSKVAEENIHTLETQNNFNPSDPELDAQAVKYAEEAKKIVGEWEKTKKDEEEDEDN
ncbi:MAG: hypothetical protein ACTSW1_16860 [Candidatus Hodarchaeales archaeon]